MNRANTYNDDEGVTLPEQGAPESSVVTLEEYLYGCVNIDVPREVIVRICLDRDIDFNEDAMSVEKSLRDLCKADLLVWMVMGVTRRGTVADSDNGWSHSDGGFTITDADKKLFLKMANKIYADNGEELIGGVKARIINHGIKPANISLDGSPLPYIVR